VEPVVDLLNFLGASDVVQGVDGGHAGHIRGLLGLGEPCQASGHHGPGRLGEACQDAGPP